MLVASATLLILLPAQGAQAAGASGGASAQGVGAAPVAAKHPRRVSVAARRGAKPQITAVRCVSSRAHCPSSTNPLAVSAGGKLRINGRHLASGMTVVFPRQGASSARHQTTISTRLHRSGKSFLVAVPASARSGRIYIVSGRTRSRSFGPIVIQGVPKPKPPASSAAGGANPSPAPADAGVFAGNAMWIWYLNKSDGGNLDTIAARASAGNFKAVYIKSSDGSTNFWSQFTPALIQALHQRNLKVCAWQYVYGTHPAAEAQLGAQAVRSGADCLIIDAEAEYEGKYASAQSYIKTLRAAVGPSLPVALAGFPYVDYHASFPFSVFLGPGAAQWNMPQMYWHDIGTSVERVFSHTYTQNQIYGRPILPLGQTYGGTPPSEIVRFRQLAQAYGAPGNSFWDWQETTSQGWSALNRTLSAPAAVDTTSDYPTLAQGAQGDQVLWLQEHLAAAQRQTPTSGKFDVATTRALSAFQSAKGLPVTGTTDPATWTAVLATNPVAMNWTGGG